MGTAAGKLEEWGQLPQQSNTEQVVGEGWWGGLLSREAAEDKVRRLDERSAQMRSQFVGP